MPAGRDGPGVAGEVPAGREGAAVGEGLTCTCTSAAKRVPLTATAAAIDNQSLTMSAYATQCSRFRNLNSRRNGNEVTDGTADPVRRQRQSAPPRKYYFLGALFPCEFFRPIALGEGRCRTGD